MGYDAIPYDKRIKENIRNYSLSNLYDMEIIKKYLNNLAEMLELNILLTDRHGEKEIVIGDSFLGFHPDVVEEPGRKLKVQGRTIGHLYIKRLNTQRDVRLTDEMVDGTVELLARLGQEAYLHRESSIYLEELENKLGSRQRVTTDNEREDVLTGVFNKPYFESKMKVIDRPEVVPVAAITAAVTY